MNINHRRHIHRFCLATAAATLASAVAFAGIVSSSAAARDVQSSQDEVDAALEEGGSLTYWSWGNGAEAAATAFEEKYPNVDVEVVNVGTGNDHYTALQNAILAGDGAPDVAQVEFAALPQFAAPGYLVDLREYGFDELADDYVAGAWEAAHFGEGLYALPTGGGPMVMLYNQRVFDEHDIAVPTTWDEYVAAARKLHEADPSAFITSDTGDAGFVTAMIWQAGGRPFSVDGAQVTIDLQDEGTLRFTEIWNPLLEEDLLASIPGWTEEWFRAISDGTIATLVAGGWMADVLVQAAPDGAGDWRVAPLPTYDGGEPVSAEHGGSTDAVIAQTDNPALAAGFVRFLDHEQGNDTYMATGGMPLPAQVANLEDPEWLDAEWEYYGGQQVNHVIVDAANAVAEGWQFLPYQTYASSIFGDTVGESYLNQSDLNEGLVAWQEQLVEYGRQQGFEVNGD